MGTLMKRSSGSSTKGIVAGVASAIVPGVGQFVNGESEKALGLLAVFVVSGFGLLGVIPLVGPLAAAVHLGTRVYGAADGYIQGRK